MVKTEDAPLCVMESSTLESGFPSNRGRSSSLFTNPSSCFSPDPLGYLQSRLVRLVWIGFFQQGDPSLSSVLWDS